MSETKQIHFLVGMYRSGGTLLSALLNQHPKIYSSPLSPIADYMWNCQLAHQRSEDVRRNPDGDRFTRMMRLIPQNYYSDVEKPIVFDRQKMWTTAQNFELIKTHLTRTPKIVFTVRNLLEVLASMELMFKDVDRFNSGIVNNDFSPSYYLPVPDYRGEFFMESNGYIQRCLAALHTVTTLSNVSFVHFVDYKELVTDTQNTMTRIYNFIGVEDYDNDLNNIKKLEKNEVEPDDGPQNLHDVSPTIVKSVTNPEEVLSKYLINKYKPVAEYWEERVQKAIERQKELNVRY